MCVCVFFFKKRRRIKQNVWEKTTAYLGQLQALGNKAIIYTHRLLNHWKVLSKLWHCHYQIKFTILCCARSSQLWNGLNSVIHPQRSPPKVKTKFIHPFYDDPSTGYYLNLIQSSYCSSLRGWFCPKGVLPYSLFDCLPFACWCYFGLLLLVRLHTAHRSSHLLQYDRILHTGQPRE